jgi:hypothetical protein
MRVVKLYQHFGVLCLWRDVCRFVEEHSNTDRTPYLFIAVNIICCNTSVKQETKVEEVKMSKTDLLDSLFYKVNMDFFEIPSIPYDESTRTRTLKVVYRNSLQ